jgi:putative transposase
VDESKEDTVVKNGHSEEQTLRALRRAESGTRVADICREHGSRQATFDIWKRKYSELGLSELRELRQLREENAKLKHFGRQSFARPYPPGDRERKTVRPRHRRNRKG